MYEFIKGNLIEKTATHVIIETNGVGYLIHISLETYNQLPPENTIVSCFTTFIIKEENANLYGFFSKPERELFHILISVSGVGPKTALALIGHLGIENFGNAIVTGDTKLISKVPKIGKKTAERLVVELKDKLKTLKPTTTSFLNDAISALTTLGYNVFQAQKAVNIAHQKSGEKETGKLISLALKNL